MKDDSSFTIVLGVILESLKNTVMEIHSNLLS